MKTRNPSENYQNFRRIVRVAGLIFLLMIAATTFIAVPTAYYFVTAAITGYASPDAAILIALLIMFNIIFIEQFDALSKKKTELTTATKIQAAMILSNFPYFTEYPHWNQG